MSGSLRHLLSRAGHWKPWSEALDRLASGAGDVKARKGPRPALYADLARRRSLVIVTSTNGRAEALAGAIQDYCDVPVALFPSWRFFSFEAIGVPAGDAGLRCQALDTFTSSGRAVLVMPVSAYIQKVWSRLGFWCHPTEIKKGQEINMHSLLANLADKGYRSADLVESAGQFSRRGGVVDVFPAQSTTPVRLEFFGDTVEDIRSFSVADQLSDKRLRNLSIYPAAEYDASVAASGREMPLVFVDQVQPAASEGKGLQRLLPLLVDMSDLATLLGDVATVVDEPKETADQAGRFWDSAHTAFADISVSKRLTLGDYYLSPFELSAKLSQASGLGEYGLRPRSLELRTLALPPLPKDPEGIGSEVRPKLESGWLLTMVAEDRDHLDRIGALAREAEISPADRDLKGAGTGLFLIEGHVEEGFAIPEAKMAVYGLKELALRQARRRLLLGPERKKALIEFRGMRPGDLLVHELHGIAQFGGLVRRSIGEVEREYVLLEYAGGDKLYLPVEQLGKVSRYVGPEGDRAKITRLGSGEWIRSQRQARRAVRKLAIDLLSLYAERLKATGYAYPPDTEWQKEMELAFPFRETRGQLRAIEDVKADLESPFPMDRLVCGDVGYGKTEVSLRAAFKVVLEGKQVLLLAPTTVLAEQHFRSFSERLSGYPVRVEMLSRFLPSAKRREILRDVAEGKVDILIGTHRVLQKDVRLPKIGLVIIDEEQRFGVGQKEKLRERAKNVDVLSLSATPIPRTLQMSMSGIRDMTTIDTPPLGRRPVLTYVGEFKRELIKEALERELMRGGQVFYVHNTVATIDQAAESVRELVPGASVVVAHGRMSSAELEKVMLDFYHGDAQVLVCTSIIESGLDIANANTLVVENADRLGLAQMYQLRGRVGRGETQAFAYFTYPAGRRLSEQSRERLATVAEFAELGSGLKIALRDLEIRGAGDLLGPEQHGHMAAVGFDLYCRMLADAVDEARGVSRPTQAETELDIPVSGYLPESYVADPDARLEIYRDITTADLERLGEIGKELRDRFGSLPEVVERLLSVAAIRRRLSSAGVERLSLKGARVTVRGIAAPPAAAPLAPGVKEVKFDAERAELRLRLAKPPQNVLQFLEGLLSVIIPAGKSNPEGELP